MSDLAQELAAFVVETRYEDLPPQVVLEAKHILMDSIGCALAAHSTDKAKMSVALAKRLGGPPEASIIGTGYKVSCSNAALANGELMMCIDYSSIMFPGAHIAVHAVPAPLAMAESVGATGKDLILAIALAHELGSRVLSGVPHFDEADGRGIRRLERYGHAACNFGAAAGAGKILKLDRGKMINALGIAGHLCQVLTHGRMSRASHATLLKYAVPGWQSTGALMAALLAEMGYTGDSLIFDSEAGFWKFAGYAGWNPERVMKGLGQQWYFLDVRYKLYPCCGQFHTVLDCFCNIINQNDLMPEEIESVTALSHPTFERTALFNNKELENIVDAQFSLPYVLSVAAHRVSVGVEWQDQSTMRDPKIRQFMDRVIIKGHPNYAEQKAKNPATKIGAVEVVARGQTFREERLYPKGRQQSELPATDQDLAQKFRHNAIRALTQTQIDRAVSTLFELERLDNVSELMSCVTL